MQKASCNLIERLSDIKDGDATYTLNNVCEWLEQDAKSIAKQEVIHFSEHYPDRTFAIESDLTAGTEVLAFGYSLPLQSVSDKTGHSKDFEVSSHVNTLPSLFAHHSHRRRDLDWKFDKPSDPILINKVIASRADRVVTAPVLAKMLYYSMDSGQKMNGVRMLTIPTGANECVQISLQFNGMSGYKIKMVSHMGGESQSIYLSYNNELLCIMDIFELALDYKLGMANYTCLKCGESIDCSSIEEDLFGNSPAKAVASFMLEYCSNCTHSVRLMSKFTSEEGVVPSV